ncbi:MAG: hypothetical protein GY715_22280 [Planctomycetes bacterium]|nr:hypothetical protein [Planctomycetota bacterium]
MHPMRTMFAAAGAIALLGGCGGEDEQPAIAIPEVITEEVAFEVPAEIQGRTLTGERVEIGCAMCIHEIPGADRCHPSVLVKGVALPLSGFELENPHAFCAGPATAVVSGTIGPDGFVATNVVLD